MRKPRFMLPLGALLALAVALPGRASPNQATQAFDVKDCASCHDKATGPQFQHSRHAGLEQSCTKCHEGAVEHGQAQVEGKQAPGPSLKNLKASAVNQTCLECHGKDTNRTNWDGGVHDRRSVSCISCHSIHDYKSVKAQLKTARDVDTCGSCHPAIRAKTMRTSHHPVREGKLDCASCHNPHDGATPKMVKGNWTTEVCLTCHTEKRGPFLWEHAPVRENCALCHDPHGSNHDKLLVAKQPFLCQRCHLNTRHPGTLYDGANTLAGASLSNRAVEHACKNCHQNIHGGNAPSGPYFGR